MPDSTKHSKSLDLQSDQHGFQFHPIKYLDKSLLFRYRISLSVDWAEGGTCLKDIWELHWGFTEKQQNSLKQLSFNKKINFKKSYMTIT